MVKREFSRFLSLFKPGQYILLSDKSAKKKKLLKLRRNNCCFARSLLIRLGKFISIHPMSYVWNIFILVWLDNNITVTDWEKKWTKEKKRQQNGFPLRMAFYMSCNIAWTQLKPIHFLSLSLSLTVFI